MHVYFRGFGSGNKNTMELQWRGSKYMRNLCFLSVKMWRIQILLSVSVKIR